MILNGTQEQIVSIKKGMIAPFDGFLMSPGYLQAVGDIKIGTLK